MTKNIQTNFFYRPKKIRYVQNYYTKNMHFSTLKKNINIIFLKTSKKSLNPKKNIPKYILIFLYAFYSLTIKV